MRVSCAIPFGSYRASTDQRARLRNGGVRHLLRNTTMNTNISRQLVVHVALVAAFTISSAHHAGAQSSGNTFKEQPRGAGTETGDGRVGEDRVYSGVQLAALVGVGYGFGAGGRVGYVFRPGLYVGGALTYYTGNATFIGGEVGYKFFINSRWELEPYVFVGPALVRAGDSGFGRAADATVVAFQPGFIGAYHFGPVFVFAEVKVYVTPSPGALGFFGGIGFAP